MIKARLVRLLLSLGYRIQRRDLGFTADELAILRRVEGFTTTGEDRVVGLIQAVQYLTANRIPGDFVECGVWRGGSMMAAMLTLLAKGDTTREFYLFDTYEGNPEPSERDVMYDGRKAKDLVESDRATHGAGHKWCVAGLDDVRQNLLSTGYPENRIHLIQGKVEDTLPKQAPEHIALLRLDTNWYASTAHELTHLYPRLSEHGILIIDDYGHWEGARQAVDGYFAKEKLQPMLCRMDYTGRLMVKPCLR